MTLQDVYKAKERLESVTHTTELEYSETFSKAAKAQIFLKCENRQKTGSFKVRGAYNKISKIADEKSAKCVVASSAGNHAQGVAFAARKLGLESYIIMPLSTPIAKISATENYGANVILSGECYDDAYNKALEVAKEKNGLFVHPFDDEEVIAGQGTVALELMEQMPDLDAVIVPAGGGGLLAGVAFTAKQINPKLKVYGVQGERADAIRQSYLSKSHVSTSGVYTIADGIAVKNPGGITTKIINEYADGIFTVTDDEIASTIIQLLERAKQVVEPAGATSLAAALMQKSDELYGKKIACVLSGGNIDVGFIHKIIEKGLVSRGRQMKFSLVLSDKPGSLEKVSSILAREQANVISVQYDRMSTELGLNETILHIGCELSGFEHGEKVIRKLKESGFDILPHEQFPAHAKS